MLNIYLLIYIIYYNKTIKLQKNKKKKKKNAFFDIFTKL